jgi:hypothetical protein
MITLPKVKDLPDSELWRIMLRMDTDHAPKEIKQFRDDVTDEFHRRKVKLVPVMDCSYTRRAT